MMGFNAINNHINVRKKDWISQADRHRTDRQTPDQCFVLLTVDKVVGALTGEGYVCCACR